MIKYYINFLIFSFITLILVFSCAILIQYNIAHALLFAIASFFVSLLSLYIYFSFIHDKLSNTIGAPLSKKEKELITLKTAEKYRREFFGNVSHELKTPIFNIQGYVQTLIDGGIKDENVNMKYLKRANISVDRMINIVEDLEVISRLETDNNELDFENFNIIHLIEEVLDQLEMKANKMNIALLLKSESNSDIVYADKNKMQQVFMNLISNSIKYGKDGGTTNVRLFDMSDKLLIEVADDGIGISENALSRLFERFYRVDKNRSREIGGTGLGLAIVKHIIEGHQQTINVRSTVNIGSTFSFILEKENNN